ncbi:MAG: flagellar basal body-associated FliL family protein [Planctomycetota bacterium]
MADKVKTEATDAETSRVSSPRRKGIALGGGIVGLVATAYLLFLMAVPGSRSNRPFQGPFLVPLTPEKVTVNLLGGSKDYLVMTVNAEYLAYDEGHVTGRVEDPLYQARQKDALLTLSSSKSKQELNDTTGKEVFRAMIRETLNPLLFPILIGRASDPANPDPRSGLKPGTSTGRATMREGMESHVLHVDAHRRTIALDSGPAVEFAGTETDLLLADAAGRTVYVDVTALDPGFVGEVPIGTLGEIHQIFFGDFISQ